MGDSGAATSGAQLKLKTASRCRAPRRESRRFACDFCRKRKTKCDMPLVVGVKPRSGLDVCINCTILGVDCTFGKIQTQKCVPKQYVSNLETRQERLQRLLGKFCSSEDIVAQVGPYIKSWMDGTCSSKSSHQGKLKKGCKDSSSAVKSVPPTSKDKDWPPFPPEDLLQILVNVYFSRVNVVWPLLHRPSFETDLLKERHRRDLGFACVVLAACAVASRYCLDNRVLAKVRSAPDPHRASSDTSPMHPWNGPDPWTDDLEQEDAKARLFTDAPLISAGWKYFDRIQRFQAETTTEVTLCELQTAHLTHQFLVGLSETCTGWIILGSVIRKAQRSNLHQSKGYVSRGLESELWKRAFWCLVVSDRLAGVECGRPCYSRDEDIDIDLPLEIDDEYWSPPGDHGHSILVGQPADQPSIITAFNVYAKLSQIYHWVMRTLYAVNRAVRPMMRHAQQDGAVLAQITQALDDWKASMPRHLEWDCRSSHMTWRLQSIRVHVTYCQLQMHLYQGCIWRAKTLTSTTGRNLPDSLGDTLVTEVFDALPTCQQAIVSTVHILDSILHPMGQTTHLALADDVTTLISAAVMTCVMIITLGIGRHIPGQMIAPFPHRGSCEFAAQGNMYVDAADTFGQPDDEQYLSVCMAYLESVQDRWGMARQGMNLLKYGVKEMAVTPGATPLSTASGLSPGPLALGADTQGWYETRAVEPAMLPEHQPSLERSSGAPHQELTVPDSWWPDGDDCRAVMPRGPSGHEYDGPKLFSSWDASQDLQPLTWDPVLATADLTHADNNQPVWDTSRTSPQPSMDYSSEIHILPNSEVCMEFGNTPPGMNDTPDF